MKSILLNPLTYWLRWLYTKWKLESKYRGKHLNIEYMVEITNSTFGSYNTLFKFSRLQNVNFTDFATIGRNAQVQNTTMGKFSGIGPFSYIGLAAHPTKGFVSPHPLFYSTLGQSSGLVIVEKNLFEEYETTYIGSDVWVGNGVSVVQGVTIGDGAIIGAGSVVTKNVEPYSIVGGVPAKLIRYRFTKEQIDFLLEFKWWDKDLDWIKANKDLFLNIDLFMEKYGPKKGS
ncbi:MAG: CatB-related O-acetyltransferase [Bacteroidetes bacterium]|nr:CatB-related O-acetyltransferase [Bacteroidota bacterium]